VVDYETVSRWEDDLSPEVDRADRAVLGEIAVEWVVG